MKSILNLKIYNLIKWLKLLNLKRMLFLYLEIKFWMRPELFSIVLLLITFSFKYKRKVLLLSLSQRGNFKLTLKEFSNVNLPKNFIKMWSTVKTILRRAKFFKTLAIMAMKALLTNFNREPISLDWVTKTLKKLPFN